MATPAPKRKMFAPLENNPDVFSALAKTLGLGPGLGFHEVYSIYDDDLIAFLPRPAEALILIFPVSDRFRERTKTEESNSKSGCCASGKSCDETKVVEPLWFPQTIGNSCGLMALIHCLANGNIRDDMDKSSFLSELFEKAVSLNLTERAKLIEQSSELETAHTAAAAQGVSTTIDPEAPLDLHFVAFVRDKSNIVWELDGKRNGPIRAPCSLGPDDDMLSNAALNGTVRKYIEQERASGNDEERFSIVAMAPA